MNAEIALFAWSSLTSYFFACFTFWVLLFTCHSLQPPSTSGPTALQLYWALSQPKHWYRKRKDTKRWITVLDGSNDWLLWSKSKSPLGCVCSSAALSPVPRQPPCPETIPAIKGEKGFQSDQDKQSVFVLSKREHVSGKIRRINKDNI